MVRRKNLWRRPRRRKDSFGKIWLHIAVPIAVVAAAVLLLLLGMTLTAMQNMALAGIRENGWEMEQILEETKPDTLEEMKRLLNIAKFDMVYVIYDADGEKLLWSDKSDYEKNALITDAVYGDLLRGIDAYAKKENANETVKVDPFGYAYYYGQKEIRINGETYLLAYMGVSAPWLEWKSDFLCIGMLCMTGVLLLTLLIACDYYRIYRTRLKVEKYYQDTSCALVHDLKTPLTAIAGYAENLKENVRTEKREYYVDAICKNVDNMSHIIEEVLELARLEHAGTMLCMEEIALRGMTEEILEQYGRQIKEEQLHISVQGTLCIRADREQMKRMLENLIGNAVKYTSPQQQILIEMGNRKYSITNTGIAISKEKIKELWKPFVKGNEARTAATGTGIGLAIVREILEQHGFDGRMESRENSVCVTISF